MDDLDLRLLIMLQKDARLTNAELGQRVGLSTSAVNARLAGLRKKGVITETVVRLDPEAVGLGLLAFISVLIDSPAAEEEFLAALAAWPEVQECHHISGEYSYLLKIRVKNSARLEEFIKRIKLLTGIQRTRTTIALSTAKETATLPVARSNLR